MAGWFFFADGLLFVLQAFYHGVMPDSPDQPDKKRVKRQPERFEEGHPSHDLVVGAFHLMRSESKRKKRENRRKTSECGSFKHPRQEHWWKGLG